MGDDGSRTEPLRHAEELAAKKLHAALPANPRAAIRPAEILYIVGFFFLFAIYLDATSAPRYALADRHALEGCISQYGPGERWARTTPHKCAPMVEPPAYVMIPPVSP